MRFYFDYSRSIRCRFGRHDQGDAEHGCQGGFKPLFRGCARFCLCPCHERPSSALRWDDPRSAVRYRSPLTYDAPRRRATD